MNLTSLEGQEAIDRLLLEPLLAGRYFPRKSVSVLDIGSGAGSPAIPLKLAYPSIALWMVEAKTRKAAFLREAIRTLGLKEAYVETSRYEELLSRPELHEAMQVVTLRAVRIEPRVLGCLQAFVCPGGQLFLFRGPSGPDVPVTLTPPLTWQFTVPLVESLRSRLVVIQKAQVGGRAAQKIRTITHPIRDARFT